jgi:hypothetical protein
MSGFRVVVAVAVAVNALMLKRLRLPTESEASRA